MDTNKKYDVFGIGNALVDIVIEVDDNFITSKNVEKGLMTLVDESRQEELLEGVEISENKMKCGGSAANTVIAVSQFGGNSYYACKISNDTFGQFYLRDLKSNGVGTHLSLETLQNGTTGKCLVMTTPDAERTMNTFLGITSDFSVQDINFEQLKFAKYLYIEGYLVTSPTGRIAMLEAKKFAEAHGIKVALTFSDPSMVKYFRDEMISVVGSGVDLLFCNEEEAILFTDTSNIEKAREKLKQYADRFVITQGSNGAMIFDGDTFVDIEPYKVKAVDTNGAGDMFAGVFLYAITNGHSYAEAGKLASLAASKIVSQFGPRLDISQVESILEQLTVD